MHDHRLSGDVEERFVGQAGGGHARGNDDESAAHRCISACGRVRAQGAAAELVDWNMDCSFIPMDTGVKNFVVSGDFFTMRNVARGRARRNPKQPTSWSPQE
ncbi:hypothetical protein GCM10007285_31810 [Stappia taiwanensis]|nr:hypothetical protein GCM10007285_31810 [Stappia taiwanensis]